MLLRFAMDSCIKSTSIFFVISRYFCVTIIILFRWFSFQTSILWRNMQICRITIRNRDSLQQEKPKVRNIVYYTNNNKGKHFLSTFSRNLHDLPFSNTYYLCMSVYMCVNTHPNHTQPIFLVTIYFQINILQIRFWHWAIQANTISSCDKVFEFPLGDNWT